MISPGFYFIFSKFWFSGFVIGVKGQKGPKSTKSSVCHASYLGKHMIFIYGTHV